MEISFFFRSSYHFLSYVEILNFLSFGNPNKSTTSVYDSYYTLKREGADHSDTIKGQTI